MVLPLLYTTTKILLMPAALQVETIALILSLESKAVLAAVVIQAPLIALTSQEGVGGVMGGVGVCVPEDPLEHADENRNTTIKDHSKNCLKLVLRLSIFQDYWNYITNLIKKIINSR